ncbi:RNA-binding protein lark-like isoform X2 [Biomphalaria glabrata]|uniref:RNA-binding protein lark-like isoform X2 n=1 Tax=Biomphalaria glabrata TaxID=6526 RepID=A0A9W2ZWC9_BIOGL|nr:RNA-binding protein lark-like isoform X2 [Biomphalaria glabrata]
MTIKIFLGNLSSETTSDKIRPLFEKYGQVVECDVLKNFGFVHMVNKNEANKAIAQLDGYSVDGNNIRVELSTGKKGGGGGGGKFDKKGFGGNRNRPYGPPQGRGDPRDYDRYPYPPPPPAPYDRYDPYYRYYMEREAYYARMAPLPGDRGYPPAAARDRYLPVPPPRDRLADRYAPDPRERLMPPRSYMDERSRGIPDPYLRERDPLASRPPPEYYDRKPMGAGRGVEPSGAAGAATGRGVGAPGAYGNGVGGDFYRNMDRPGVGMGGAAGGAGDFFRQGSNVGQQNSYGRPGMGGTVERLHGRGVSYTGR